MEGWACPCSAACRHSGVYCFLCSCSSALMRTEDCDQSVHGLNNTQEFSHHTKELCDQGVVNFRCRRSCSYVKHSDDCVKDPILNTELELIYTPVIQMPTWINSYRLLPNSAKASLFVKGGGQLAPPPTICCSAANQSHERFQARLWDPY